MAVRTRTPGGSWVRVTPADTYAGVVSKYSDVLKQAKEDEQQAELEMKAMAYTAGTLSYQSFKSYLQETRAKYDATSLKGVRIDQALVDLESSETEKLKASRKAQLETSFAKNGITAAEQLIIEREMLALEKTGTPAYETQQAEVAKAQNNLEISNKNERLANMEALLSAGGLTKSEEINLLTKARDEYDKGSQDYAEIQNKINAVSVLKAKEDLNNKLTSTKSALLEKFMPDGLTTEESLQIIQSLKQLAPKGSEAYNEIIVEEAKVRTTLQNEKEANASKGKKAADDAEKQRLLNAIAPAIISNAQIDDLVKTGQMTEAQAEKERLTNWQTIGESLKGTGQSITVGDQEVDEFEASQQQAILQNRVTLRDQGQLLEVQTRDGKIETVSNQDLQNDLEGKYNVAVTKDPVTNQWKIADALGQLGDTPNAFATEEEALSTAKKLGIASYNAVITAEDGSRDIAFAVKDPNSGGFFLENSFQKNEKTGSLELVKGALPSMAIPTTSKQVEQFRAQGPIQQEQPKAPARDFTQTSLGTLNINPAPITQSVNQADTHSALVKEQTKKPTGDLSKQLGPINDFKLDLPTQSFNFPDLNIKSLDFSKFSLPKMSLPQGNKEYGPGLAQFGTKKSSTFLPDFGITEKLGIGKAINKVKSLFGK